MEFSLMNWDFHYSKIILVNLAIIILIFTLLRSCSKFLGHDIAKDLLKKNNSAFGISIAGITIAIAIILKGAIFGELANNITDSVVAIGLYSLIAIGLLYLTRIIFDNISLPHINIRNEINKGNQASAVIDAGNVIATSIILGAVISWITSNTVERIMVLIIGYLVSQTILVSTTFIRIRTFANKNKVELENEFKKGNISLALRFAGRKIGTAFAIMAASHIMTYELNSIHILLFNWVIISLVTITILWALSKITDLFIFSNIDTDKEILKNNVALGAWQGTIYIALGLLMSELIL